MRICTIGAGASGLPVVKALADAGLSFDTFEQSSVVGGLWVYDNPGGPSAAYRSLHINTSRDRMAYADLPMPREWPDFLHHSLVARYLRDYAERFDLTRRITFGTKVVRAARTATGWSVTLSTGETRDYDVLVVANGHHWDPRGPEPAPPGAFRGPQIHSHAYRDPTHPLDLRDRRVLVVGFGNSAMDLATELGDRTTAARVLLSVRRGGWVIPRYLFGRPLDTFTAANVLPVALRDRALTALLSLAVGRPDRYGLPRPDHGLLRAHPTISGEILGRLGAGDVVAKPGIAELLPDAVRFVDGTVEPVDAIVWCTGYRLSFPFFDPAYLDPRDDNELPLYLHVWRPDDPAVAFVGLVQPLGAIQPIAERQAKMIADWLAGRLVLPDRAAMERRARRDRERMRRRYVPSKRHTIQVDYDDYQAGLLREWARGKARAAGGLRGAWARLRS
jgi:dimethylaniline monooxygenase (N-oxide forming)